MERRGRGKLRNMYKVPMDNSVGVDCGDGWGLDGAWESNGEKSDTTIIEQQ